MNRALFFCLLALLIQNGFKPTESIDNTVARARNQYLRFYVFDKRRILHKTYNYLLSKYYDSFIFYYSLSEKERELFDQVMNTWY